VNSTVAFAPALRELPALLRGELEATTPWLDRWQRARLGVHVVVILAGAGLFGAAIGCWRAPLAAFYTALKLPLIIMLTTLGNALLNAMLAPLLGANLSPRQTLLTILLSFTLASAILGSLSPLLFFVVWNTPPLAAPGAGAGAGYSFLLVAQTAMIALAGVVANLRLMQMLQRLSGSRAVARRVMLAWLAGNLLLGSQLAWNLRPFVGSPGLPVEFLRANAFQGNFFEALLRSMRELAGP
jgi:hypothetical protein